MCAVALKVSKISVFKSNRKKLKIEQEVDEKFKNSLRNISQFFLLENPFYQPHFVEGWKTFRGPRVYFRAGGC